MEAELVHRSRGNGPVADWNASYPMGTKVRWSEKATKTRSGAWSDGGGQALVMVVGHLLPGALVSVVAVEVIPF